MASPDPARDHREAAQGRKDLKRTGRNLVLGLLALIVIVGIAVALGILLTDLVNEKAAEIDLG